MGTPEPGVIRRQEHGIKAAPLNMTVPGAMKARLAREAQAQGISLSRHVVNLIVLAWSVRDALATPGAAADEESEAA